MCAYIWCNLFKGGRVNSIFEARGIECNEYSRAQIDEVINLMEILTPDLIISVNCNVRLPQLLLSKAKFGGVNMHQGSLPFYKGLMPIFYSQLAGENKAGSSIHIMNSEFDSGEILIQEEVDIFPGENYVKIWKKLNKLGSVNLIKVLSYFEENNDLPRGLRQEVAGKYYSLPSIKLVMQYFFLQVRYKFWRLGKLSK